MIDFCLMAYRCAVEETSTETYIGSLVQMTARVPCTHYVSQSKMYLRALSSLLCYLLGLLLIIVCLSFTWSFEVSMFVHLFVNKQRIMC